MTLLDVDIHGGGEDHSMGEVPLVVCIAGNLENRVKLTRLLDGYGVVLMVPDASTARSVLGERVEQRVRTHRPVIRLGYLRIDHSRLEVTWRDVPLELTNLEREVLTCLADEPGRVWSYEQLHVAVWRTDFVGDRSSIHSAVKRLRRKLRDAGVDLRIQASRGIGFRLTSTDPVS
ncbi:MAG TPA: winged helix-turn-helix domain-containing protein [Mycobacteriales bacterium]|nr:winged helix-turn-helix domain-containing protein [Mycobacteriales bacterium]